MIPEEIEKKLKKKIELFDIEDERLLNAFRYGANVCYSELEPLIHKLKQFKNHECKYVSGSSEIVLRDLGIE